MCVSSSLSGKDGTKSGGRKATSVWGFVFILGRESSALSAQQHAASLKPLGNDDQDSRERGTNTEEHNHNNNRDFLSDDSLSIYAKSTLRRDVKGHVNRSGIGIGFHSGPIDKIWKSNPKIQIQSPEVQSP